MKSEQLEKILLAYETDVRFPDVSGMEHLDMLLTRSKIQENLSDLTLEQQTRLAIADELLVRQSNSFYAAIREIADLAAWRENAEATPNHWWWYLDVIAYAQPRFQTAEKPLV